MGAKHGLQQHSRTSTFYTLPLRPTSPAQQVPLVLACHVHCVKSCTLCQVMYTVSSHVHCVKQCKGIVRNKRILWIHVLMSMSQLFCVEPNEDTIQDGSFSGPTLKACSEVLVGIVTGYLKLNDVSNRPVTVQAFRQSCLAIQLSRHARIWFASVTLRVLNSLTPATHVGTSQGVVKQQSLHCGSTHRASWFKNKRHRKASAQPRLSLGTASALESASALPCLCPAQGVRGNLQHLAEALAMLKTDFDSGLEPFPQKEV